MEIINEQLINVLKTIAEKHDYIFNGFGGQNNFDVDAIGTSKYKITLKSFDINSLKQVIYELRIHLKAFRYGITYINEHIINKLKKRPCIILYVEKVY